MSEMWCSIDPGETTGFAIFVDGKPESFGKVKFKEFNAWLAEQNPDLFLVENYLIRPPELTGGRWIHQWDEGKTLQLIGAIEFKAYLLGVPVIRQEPSAKVMGYTLMKMEYKRGKKDMHVYDALAHGYVYKAKQDNLRFTPNGQNFKKKTSH